jgi:hypothetical protein
MIGGLSPLLQYATGGMSVGCALPDNLDERLPAHGGRTRTGGQDPFVFHHPHGPQIDLLVPTPGFVQLGRAPGERRRIQGDEVIATVVPSHPVEDVKSVVFNDLGPIHPAVSPQVLPEEGQSVLALVDERNAIGPALECVQSPPTRVTETIQSLAPHVSFKRLTVLPLIQEIPRFLSVLQVRENFERFPTNPNAIRNGFPAQQSPVTIQSVLGTDGQIVPDVDRARGQQFFENFENFVPVILHRGVTFLNDQVVPVSVNHEPGQKIGVGVNQSVTQNPIQDSSTSLQGRTDTIAIIVEINVDLRLGYHPYAGLLPREESPPPEITVLRK